MKIKNGIYLIIDPSMNRDILMDKIKAIIQEGIAAIQIWDHFKSDQDPVAFCNEILALCHGKNIPVLINNQRELLKLTHLDGIHFDTPQDDILDFKKELKRQIITGITCNNDLSVVEWANKNEFDYLSFCSMFPSSTANSCELVAFDTVREARKITSLSIFLAGGIKPDNMALLDELDYSGIAVVSGIISADQPVAALKAYQQKIKSY